MDDLLERVARLPDQSIIYYLHIFKDGHGQDFVPAEALERLAPRANAPIYGHVDTFVGRGIVGGHVYAHEVEGRTRPASACESWLARGPNRSRFRRRARTRTCSTGGNSGAGGSARQSLPPGSVVHHKEPTFWDVYEWHIIGVIALCVVEALLIAGLLVQRVKRRRADERFRQVVETAPTGMLMVGRDGTIVMVNAQVEKLFGYRRDELLGSARGNARPRARPEPAPRRPRSLLRRAGVRCHGARAGPVRPAEGRERVSQSRSG